MRERPSRGLLDTSVVIDLPRLDPERLPDEFALSAITLAELAAGPHAAADPEERARRQERLQWVEANLDVLPFDEGAARSYGRICAAVHASGPTTRGARTADLMIAAVAAAHGLPLYTLNGEDFAALGETLEVVALG